MKNQKYKAACALAGGAASAAINITSKDKKGRRTDMKHPENWEQMTQEEQMLWIYENATPGCRFSTRTKKAGKRLAQLILDDEELSGVKITELTEVFDQAKAHLKTIYGQISLRQAAEIFEAMPEDEISYARSDIPR